MTELQYTLLSDGPADRALMPILTWLLHNHLPNCAVQPKWGDLTRMPRPPRTLHERIQTAVELYPCHLLFVHRDAERTAFLDRNSEIEEAVNNACHKMPVIQPAIAVVPVRMMEAWLLFDEQAITAAAGNPNSSVRLDLPRLTGVENIPDPKNVLHGLILEATELGAHRRKRFKVGNAVQRIPQYIDDFSPLRVLPAFQALEGRLLEVIREQEWHL